jgi:hypothetical protein
MRKPGWLHGTPLNETAWRILTLWGRTTSRFATKPALLDGTDLSALKDPLQRTALADQPGAEEFLTNMRAYACGVGTRYESFLREIGREEAGDLHQLISRQHDQRIARAVVGLAQPAARSRSVHHHLQVTRLLRTVPG